MKKMFLIAGISLVIGVTGVAGGETWYCATNSAPWLKRACHSSVVFDNKMWIIGGNNISTECFDSDLNDVWHSADGVNWTCATGDAQWTSRWDHTSVVFDNKMWVMGGTDFTNNPPFANNVWYSTDEVNWVCATNNAPWSRRASHSSVVFDNKMWVMGGWNLNELNDVWYSTDGVNWVCATDSAQWSPRSRATLAVFDNKMWIIGGHEFIGNFDMIAKRDVWYSTDGVDWVCATDSAPWTRGSHASVVADNKIWVIGGIDSTGTYMDDAWYSTDGINWVCATISAEWCVRFGHTSVVFNNRIWVIGGEFRAGSGCFAHNDVWYSEEHGITEQVISLDESILVVSPLVTASCIKIKYRNTGVDEMSIYNITGTRVKSFELPNVEGEIIWNLQSESGEKLPPGVYFIQIGVQDISPVAKFVILY